MGWRRTLALALALALPLGGCGGSDDGASPAVDGVEVPDSFDVVEVRTGLRGPTQISPGPDGKLLVAQLNGGEGDGTGQVLLVDLESNDPPTVLFDELLKPTGVALLGDEVWVMEERTLSRGPSTGGELAVVLDELPYNGRSEGTLTATPDGRLLYDTSGTIDGTAAADGSGILWALSSGGEQDVVASGLKNAYARTYDDTGTLWQTEISGGHLRRRGGSRRTGEGDAGHRLRLAALHW